MNTNTTTQAGYVAVIGRPNAGKSSLLNWLVGEKLALVSHKANATRKRLNIIAMHENAQIIFIDTPGIHEQERLLNQFMLEEAMKAMGDCDLILFLTPVSDKIEHYRNFLELNKQNTNSLKITFWWITKQERLVLTDEQTKELWEKWFLEWKFEYKKWEPVKFLNIDELKDVNSEFFVDCNSIEEKINEHDEEEA